MRASRRSDTRLRQGPPPVATTLIGMTARAVSRSADPTCIETLLLVPRCRTPEGFQSCIAPGLQNPAGWSGLKLQTFACRPDDESMSIARRQTLFVVTVLLASAAGIFFVARLMEERGGVLVTELTTLDDRGVMYVEEIEAFVVARRPTPIALSAIDPHLGHLDTYCRSSGMFEGRHGEKYDRLGIYYAGPAPRGLDRFQVRVDGADVYVYPDDRSPGPPRSARAEEPAGPFCS